MTDQGLELLVQREALMLVAYPDPESPLFKTCTSAGITPYNNGYQRLVGWEAIPGNPWTIGVGHTGGVKAGDTCTREQALEMLRADLAWVDRAVALVRCPLEPHQGDALRSFIFNIGAPLWEGSTMLHMLNGDAPDMAAVALQFDRWHTPASITTRRNGEKFQFMGAAFHARCDAQGNVIA